MRRIFEAHNILEAHIVAGLLKNNGIECHVSGHHLQGAVGDLPAIDFAHVYVHNEEDVPLASTLILQYESNQL